MISVITAIALQTTGPVLPVGVAPHLARLNYDVQTALAAGDFATATTKLTTWPTGRLSYKLEGLPSRYAGAAESAVALLKEVSQSRIEFVEGDTPAVIFQAAKMPDDGPAEPEFRDGLVRMQVPITDRSGADANIRSIVWSLAKGMAYAAGLDNTTRRRSLMGPVAYTKSLSDPVFSLREQTVLSQIEDVRRTLVAAATSKTKISPANPEIKVSTELVDMGQLVQGDKKAFKLTLTNTGNADAKIEIETTCSCLIATPSMTLAAGKSIEIEPKFDSSDYEGALEKHLYVLSNSAIPPRKTVVLKATVLPEFRFLAMGAKPIHGEAALGDVYELNVSDTGATTLELFFFGSVDTINLNDVQLGNEAAIATVVPFEGKIDHPDAGSVPRRGSKVIVEIPATWPFGTSWLRVVGVTDSKRKPVAELTLQIRKGISATPQNVYFGDAKVGVETERSVILEHSSKAFKIKKIETSEGVNAKFEPLEGGDRKYRIRLSLTPKVAGQLSGSASVLTDSPAQPIITIAIGGQAG